MIRLLSALALLAAALSACAPFVPLMPELPVRVPVVDEPACARPYATPPARADEHTLRTLAACDTLATSTASAVYFLTQANGDTSWIEVVVEERILAQRVGDDCVLTIESESFERKEDELLPLSPVAARVSLCAARVRTSRPLDLEDVAVTVRQIEVGSVSLLTSPVLAVITTEDDDDACAPDGPSAEVASYAYQHRAIVSLSMRDLRRLAYDGTLELAYGIELH